jgi:transcriptional regulator of PTS gene
VIEYRVFAAAIAEAAYGAARDIPDFVYLNIDTGVATATVASGQLVRSSIQPTGITGGLGHVLTTSSPKPCFCGNSGCLHNEITTQALTLQLKELLKLGRGHGLGEFWEDHEPTFLNLIEAINHQDALALQLRTRFIEHLGIVVRAAIQLFSANLLIIGGPTIQFGGKQAIQAAQEAAQQLTILHELLGKTRVVASDLKPDSATVGAATLVVHALMNGQILPRVQESPQKVTLSTGGQ